MSESIVINSESSLRDAHQWLDEQWRRHLYIEVEVKRKAKQRSQLQNKSMHKFFALLAEVLNDAGLDMRHVLKQDVDIPWTPENVKNHLWRPIQQALVGKESTTEITTVEPTEIHAVLSRHLGEKFGVVVPPWPSREAA